MRCRWLLQNPRIKISIENNQWALADMVLQLLRNIGPEWRTDQIIVIHLSQKTGYLQKTLWDRKRLANAGHSR
ncbi:TPA: hypothetical protein ACOVJJ_004511 [Klebsiella oxytoca]